MLATYISNISLIADLFATKRKDKLRPRFSPDTAGLRGALSWRVVAEDCSSKTEVEAFVGISSDSLVLIQDNLHTDILFATATKSIIGWTAFANSIRIYFHMGEALVLHSKDWESEDMKEISQRLKAVTNGAPTQEFSLRRNQVGQLGFHVQHDGLITEVENFGYAWQSGLRQGSRLVEICKHPVTALTHEQMVELLKTSMTVTVTVIPPFPDGQPRKGCHLQNCGYVYGALDVLGDYDNFSSSSSPETGQQQQAPQATTVRQIICDRGPNSPPRSSNSSGYGTGSSRKSFSDQQRLLIANGLNNNNASSGEENWYDFHENKINGKSSSSNENSPPPLPNRIGSGKSSAFQRVIPDTSVYQQPPPPRQLPEPKRQQRNFTCHQYVTPPVLFQEEKRSSDAKVTYLTEFELNRTPQIQHERLHALKSTYDGGNTTDSSSSSEQTPKRTPVEEQHYQRLQQQRLAHHRNHSIPNYHHRSEDELSAVSVGSLGISSSPRRRRRSSRSTSSSGKHLGLAPSSSTNHLARYPGSGATTPSSNGDELAIRKRSARHHPNRNSTTFSTVSTSTFQEDLMRLIGPDSGLDLPGKTTVAINGCRPTSTAGRTPPKKSSNELSLMKSRSRENIALTPLSTTSSSSATITPDYHTARPATIISNASSLNASSVSSTSLNRTKES